jgi:hypothetical protein
MHRDLVLVARGMHTSIDEHDQVLRQMQCLAPVVGHEQRRRGERREHMRQLVEQARI